MGRSNSASPGQAVSQSLPDVHRALVHPLTTAADAVVERARRLQVNPGITWGVPAMDERVIPMRPGDLVSLIGRPGSGKTTLMQVLAKREARAIRQRGQAEREAVVFVTWEQSVEELAAMFLADERLPLGDLAWGRVGVDDLLRHLPRQTTGMSIFFVGHSLRDPAALKRRLTVEVVLEAIRSMEADYGVRPTLCCLDYVQIIPIDRATERTQQVTEAVIKCKELALTVGCPVVIGVQAGRGVDDYAANLPRMSDAQWASGIEQTSDKVFGLWRPITTREVGHMIEVGSRQYPTCDTLLVVKLLKQRMESPYGAWALYFDPARLILREMAPERDNGRL